MGRYYIRPKDSKDSEAINLHTARQIILHAVSATKRRWSQYDQSWNDIDRNFIQHGYEQGGFQIFKMVPLLENRGIYSIKSLGSILSNYAGPKKYDRNYAGSLDSEFYTKLKAGKLGRIGLPFYECINIFLAEKVGNPGAFFWRMIWQLLISCNFLNREYNSSFSEYIRSEYAAFMGENNFSDRQFLDISSEDWHVFLGKVKPWRPLYGIGQNVFDFIFGDIVEARFVNDSFKFDSANQHFCRVTGIDDLIRPFDRDNTIQFLKTLDFPYTLREINKGIYTYCSKTEEANFGFCRSKDKCFDCGVDNLCKHRIKGYLADEEPLVGKVRIGTQPDRPNIDSEVPKASSSEFNISTEGQTILEEPYSLESRLKLLPSELRPLFFDFHHRLITEIGSGEPMPRTHKVGITYRTDRGAYIWANFYKKFISLMLFTGSKEIPGLKKTTWIKGGDQKGSLFHIREKEDIPRAVEYGKQAYRIALREKGL